MAGFNLEIATNPIAPLLNDKPLGIPLDGELEGPISSWPSGAGLGFYAVDPASIRLQRHCDWSDPTVTAVMPFEDLVGEVFEYDINAGTFVSTTNPKTPKRFTFAANLKDPDCLWSDSSTHELLETTEQIVGTYGAEAETFDVELVFDRVPYSPAKWKFDRVKRVDTYMRNATTGAVITEAELIEWGLHLPSGLRPFSLGETQTGPFGMYIVADELPKIRMLIQYNSAIGWQPVPIDSVPVESWAFNDPPSMNYSGSRLTEIMTRPGIISEEDSSGPVLEYGRSIQTHASLTNSLNFANGTWITSGNLTIGIDTRQATVLTASILSTDREVTGPAVLPVVNAGSPLTKLISARFRPRGGNFVSGGTYYPSWQADDEWYVDSDFWEITDPATAVYAAVTNASRWPFSVWGNDELNEAYLLEIANAPDGAEFDVEPLFSSGAFEAYRAFSVHVGNFPSFLGTETITVRFVPSGDSSNKTEFQRWNVFAEQISFNGLPGHTLVTDAADRVALRRTTDDVVMDGAESDGEETIDGENESYKFHTVVSPIDGQEYAVMASGTHGETYATFVSTGDSATLTRSCRCASFWTWLQVGFGGPYQWHLTEDGCGAGRTAVPPATDGTPGEKREGTCAID